MTTSLIATELIAYCVLDEYSDAAISIREFFEVLSQTDAALEIPPPIELISDGEGNGDRTLDQIDNFIFRQLVIAKSEAEILSIKLQRANTLGNFELLSQYAKQLDHNERLYNLLNLLRARNCQAEFGGGVRHGS